MTGHHDRSGFDCGVEVLNTWLQQTALQHQVKGISRSFVAVPADEAELQSWAQSGFMLDASSILGFYALSSAFVLTDDLPAKQAKRYPRQIPVTRLGCLATRADTQGQGLGQLLLADAVNRARTAAQAVGSAGLFVDAKNEAVARFYQRYGFIPGADQPLKLFLPLW
ncbi:GNAT family N-acetyltransferase [Comamonas sp. SCN 65-56]|uniref:GNAT family N-acetyltransferase n=1 Tax=Comamonas sp. SCN 65-56 TaxID=1660095 RepID=UPI0025BE662F|nr:GNAT family N-acetyltransferase [Comamonas sp. SCN 65-56]